MSILALVGIAIYMIGHGVRGLGHPNSGIVGSAAMVAGGIVVLVSALV